MPEKTAVALAIGAHPDDIEFMMAGTLLLLRNAGYETHYLNLANGSCGNADHDAATTILMRMEESMKAAGILGAIYHPSLCNDLEIFYNDDLLRRLSALVRDIRPNIILTHSPQDYMEDHTNTCRLTVTAAFVRGMPNFSTIPAISAVNQDVIVYHAMPYGLRDALRERIIPGAVVNTAPVHLIKREALAAHKSQQGWLDVSQGLNSYLLAMEEMSLEVGKISESFEHGEGWRRHLHFGFCMQDKDPLAAALGKNYWINQAYEQNLNRGI